MKILFCVLTLAILIGCQAHAALKPHAGAEKETAPTQSHTRAKVVRSIRQVDFLNFSFPWTENDNFAKKTFTLRDGVLERTKDEEGARLMAISYGDVTGDETDEAILTINVENDGNGTPTMVFVYGLFKNKPKLLQSFGFDWGFPVRNAFAESGNLIVENYRLCQEKDPCCCPSFYEMTRYQWRKEKFVPYGETGKISIKKK